ncbi:MAG: preprotein translocase subunit SecA [bacterium]|nr:preprotein translocase subunit SecA [bacterium]
MSILSSIFGDSNARVAKAFEPLVLRINSFAEEYEALSDAELRGKTGEFKKRLTNGETLDDILPEAFAAVREAARRTLKLRHFDVQLIGGIVLHQGKIAEMKTGEGKTLVATLPLYLNSLTGKGCHLVTPNDYLSRVGGGWMGPVYTALGVSVGVIAHELSGIYDPSFQDPHSHGDTRLEHWRPVSRREAYGADITYGTNNEFGFDYLRGNLAYFFKDVTQREHHFAIVDEVDAILIDEARTPLIISAPDTESSEYFGTFAKVVPHLEENTHYNVDAKFKAVTITEEGIEKVEKLLGVKDLYAEKGFRYVRYLEQALRAQALFLLDRDYVVKNGEVIIVDEFTGRLMPGRRWSEGLHQAIEAKEGVPVQKESRTLATITFQNYFRMYEKLAGMTGTAETSAEEFSSVYRLDVVTIPTHRPMVRLDSGDLIFRTEKGKFMALVREIKERHEKGQPVLIGTVSIEKNERLSALLQREGVSHELLNAKNHEREALVIAQAGRKGVVTVATNMAGRGVDIILGGTPLDPAEAEEVRGLGGLHVIGTERHEARRIDNQLRGRAGRQGDPGSSQFFVSLEDDLMKIFGSDRVKRMMESFGIPEDQSIENNIVSKALESAQAKIEGFHFDARKHVLEYDNVMNKQREAVYRMRKEILVASGIQDSDLQTPRERITEMIREEIARMVDVHTAGYRSDWNTEEIFEEMKAIAGVANETHARLEAIREEGGDEETAREDMKEYLLATLRASYDIKVTAVGEEGMKNLEKVTLLQTIDMLWMDHLDTMAHLRDSVRLRAYGQRDPLVEYKNEGVKLFRELQVAVRAQVVNTIFKVGLTQEQTNNHQHHHHAPNLIFKSSENQPSVFGNNKQEAGSRKPEAASGPGRNDPCPCGSGKKYKKCHGK